MYINGVMNAPYPDMRLEHGRHEDAVRYFMDFFGVRPRRPEVDFLRQILEHFATLPYENLSKIIKLNRAWESPNRIRLPEEVIDEHASFRLGGTCFSLTFFLESILKSFGFEVYPVMADMGAGRNIHCCLIVRLDGVKHLVDPGYVLTQPMALHPQKPRLYRTEFTGVELRFDGRTQRYHLYTFDRQQVKWRYSFADRPVPPQEFLQHWLASFHWNSMHGLCLTRVLKDGLIFVHKNFMRETRFTGKRNYNIKRNYHATIHKIFNIHPEVIEKARVALEQNLARERELGLWVPKDQRKRLQEDEAS